MTVLKIACLDVLAPAVQAETRDVASPDFEIRFANSYEPAEQLDLASGADFLLVGSAPVTAALLERCGRVRLIQKYGVGIDKIDLEAARRAGVPVAIAAGGNAAPVSELALGLMIAVNRRMVFADRKTREGVWLKKEMRSWCYQLDGKTVGLLGFGAIARLTARRLSGFDVQVLYHSTRRADPGTEHALRAQCVSLDELLERSDILSIHLPLTTATHHLIDAQALRKMKQGAILINTARGGIVDETALCEALVSGRLRGAGLDVFAMEPPSADNPLFKLDNVVVMPHAGGGVFDNVRKVMQHAIGNMRKLLAGEPLAAADVVVPGRHA
jgi:D-3-phosphoglycerate dehydrogenase